MEIREQKIKENYSENLKAVDYADMFEKQFQIDQRVLSFPLNFMYNTFQTGRFLGTRLLEIGSGVLVHNIASASAFFPNILMSDYVEDNCEELKRWLRGQSAVRQFLDVPAELEGYGSDIEAGKQLLENRIRKNVKQVVRCDVLKDNIFMEEVKPEVAPPYDFILSSYCLEAAAPDFENFKLVLKQLNELMRPGGGMLLVGFLHGKPWKVNDTYYHHISISEEELLKALKESGFGKVQMEVLGNLNIDYEHEKCYCLVAEKL